MSEFGVVPPPEILSTEAVERAYQDWPRTTRSAARLRDSHEALRARVEALTAALAELCVAAALMESPGSIEKFDRYDAAQASARRVLADGGTTDG